MDPDLVLADEPTGNLDSTSGGDIMELFQELWEQGTTMVIITHDKALADRAPRQVEIQDGLVSHDSNLNGLGAMSGGILSESVRDR